VNIGTNCGENKQSASTQPTINIGLQCGLFCANDWNTNLGYYCGYTGTSNGRGNINIGYNANYDCRYNSTIVLRASTNGLAALNATKDSALFIDPIRAQSAYNETWFGNVLKQDTASKEVYSFNSYAYMDYQNVTSNFGSSYTLGAGSTIPFNVQLEGTNIYTYDFLTSYNYLPDRTGRYKIDVLLRGLNNLSGHYISVYIGATEIYRKYWTQNTNESMSFSLTRNITAGSQVYLKTDGTIDLNLSNSVYSQAQYTQLF
jgi:hypothetical protein